MLSRYRPRAPIIALTRCGQAARQAHLYRGVYPVLYTKPANDVWAEDVDMRVSFAMEVGECRQLPDLCSQCRGLKYGANLIFSSLQANTASSSSLGMSQSLSPAGAPVPVTPTR